MKIMNKKEKPINPFIINPENFLKLVENFIAAYPTYYHRLKQLSDLGEKECNKVDYRESHICSINAHISWDSSSEKFGIEKSLLMLN